MEQRTREQGYNEFEMLLGEIPTATSRPSGWRESRSMSPLPGWEIISPEGERAASSSSSSISMLRNLHGESSLTSAFGELSLTHSTSRIPQSPNATFSLDEGYKLNGYLYGQDDDKILQLGGNQMRNSGAQQTSNVEEMYHTVNLDYLQQLQKQQQELQQIQLDMQSSMRSSARSSYAPTQTRQGNWDSYVNNNVVTESSNNMNPLLMGCGLNEYRSQCPCARCESWFANRGKLQNQIVDRVGGQFVPDNLLAMDYALKSQRNVHTENILSHQSRHYDIMSEFSDARYAQHLLNNYEFRQASKSLELKDHSLNGVAGRIYDLARDQNGCRLLQKFIDEGSPENIQRIFDEILYHVVELLTDPLGNYLVSKLFKVCNKDQRMQILNLITRREGELFIISCSPLGSRSVQYVIESLVAKEQPLVVSCLKHNILALMKDCNGCHVVKSCLRCFLPENTEFIFDVVIAGCTELATDRQGCCVLQKCLRYSNPEQKRHLISQITSEALFLSQDQFGNYVVQYILDQGAPNVRADVLRQFTGNYGYLSVQKYSSNVVEKCLKVAENDELNKIIQELISNHRLSEISQNEFGNYVIQCAYKLSEADVQNALVQAIKPHETFLQCSPYGRSVLMAMGLRKPFLLKEDPRKAYKRLSPRDSIYSPRN